jgi:hypothetical protein
MMLSRTKLFAISLCLVALFAGACSDVENRTKSKDLSATSGKGKIALSVKKSSTTKGTSTTNGISSSIEKKITKSLTQILIEGSKKKNLFSAASFAGAKESFPDNSSASNNKASVVYNYLDSDNENETLVVASITQKITVKRKTTTRTGEIDFDTSGKVLGYNFDKVAPVTTTTQVTS